MKYILCCTQTGDIVDVSETRPQDFDQEVLWNDRLCVWIEIK